MHECVWEFLGPCWFKHADSVKPYGMWIGMWQSLSVFRHDSMIPDRQLSTHAFLAIKMFKQ